MRADPKDGKGERRLCLPRIREVDPHAQVSKPDIELPLPDDERNDGVSDDAGHEGATVTFVDGVRGRPAGWPPPRRASTRPTGDARPDPWGVGGEGDGFLREGGGPITPLELSAPHARNRWAGSAPRSS